MTLLLAISSLLSRLIGVYRNHELAGLFGASGVSDAYFAAFQIPDTLYRLFIFGAISASFVPLFLALNKKNPQEAWEFVSSVLNAFLIVLFLASVVIFAFAAPLTRLLYPEFTPELQEMTTHLLRIMMISPFLFTFSSVFSGVENAFRNFWGFALAPILYNAGILFGIFALAPTMGIYGVAYGVVIGAFLHAFIQFIPSIQMGFRWRPVFVWSDSFKKLLVTSVPRVMSLAGVQINFFIEGVIATTLAFGNLTVLRYAQDIQAFPIGIIGVSMALSSFSILSHFVIDEKMPEMASYLRDKLNHLLFLVIPAAFGLWVLRYPAIQLMLAGGIFDETAIELTAQTLSYLCFGLVAAALIPLVTRVFFAFHQTTSPFIITIFTVLGNTLLAILFARELGIAGVGLASSLTVTLSLIAMLLVLKWKYFRQSSIFSLKHFLLFLFSSAVMTFFVQKALSLMTISDHVVMLLAQILLLAIFGAGIYGVITFLFLQKKWWELVKSLGN